MAHAPMSTAEPDGALRNWFIFGVFSLVILNLLSLLPEGMSLQGYLFFDSSWPIATDALWADEGLIPGRDFNYFYGLLTLLIDRGWFAVLGRTPEAQTALSCLCVLLSAWGVIRLAAAVKFTPFGQLLLMILSSWCITPIFHITPTHALEPVFLLHAIAFQAQGRLGWALLLASLAVFIKPAMGGLYGLVLLGQLFFWGIDGSCWRNRLLQLLPAGIGVLVIGGMLLALFGWQPVLKTVFPLDANRVYSHEGYGFFNRRGSQFLLPPNPTVIYYLLGPATLWLSCSALLGLAVRFLYRERTSSTLTLGTLLLLHLLFVLVLFGNEQSWFYYSYLPGIGSIWALDLARKASPSVRWPMVLAAWLLVLYAILWLPSLAVRGTIWLVADRTEATAGLFANPTEAAAWAEIRELAQTKRVYVAAVVGGSSHLFPPIQAPRLWYLLRPIATPTEIQNITEQINQADYLVIPRVAAVSLSEWPEFQPQMKAFALEREWPGFLLVKRVLPPP